MNQITHRQQLCSFSCRVRGGDFQGGSCGWNSEKVSDESAEHVRILRVNKSKYLASSHICNIKASNFIADHLKLLCGYKGDCCKEEADDRLSSR